MVSYQLGQKDWAGKVYLRVVLMDLSNSLQADILEYTQTTIHQVKTEKKKTACAILSKCKLHFRGLHRIVMPLHRQIGGI